MAAINVVSNTARGLFKKREPKETPLRTLISPLERRHLHVKIVLNIILFLLVAGSLTFIAPMIWLFIGAIKSAPELLDVPPSLFPRVPQWGNYAQAWQTINFGLYMTNTLIITFIGWLIPMVVNVLAAFALSKLRPSLGGIIMIMFLSTMMIPGVVYIIPLYLIVVQLHLINTWFALWLPGAFSAYSILILKAFFDSLPSELSDSAVLDGANPLQILWSIVLPLSKPVLVVITIGSLMGSWQQFFAPYLYIVNPQLWPIGTELYIAFHGSNMPQNLQFAAMAITALPPMILFAIFQDRVIKGVNLSGFMNG